MTNRQNRIDGPFGPISRRSAIGSMLAGAALLRRTGSAHHRRLQPARDRRAAQAFDMRSRLISGRSHTPNA
jgi:hypothetical protein